MQDAMLSAIVATAHHKVGGCADNGYGENTADRYSYDRTGWDSLGLILITRSSCKTKTNLRLYNQHK